MNVPVAMCSMLRLRTDPTMTTGFALCSRTCRSIQGCVSRSSIMPSATNRESVSFQNPLRSVVVPGSIRRTRLPQPATSPASSRNMPATRTTFTAFPRIETSRP